MCGSMADIQSAAAEIRQGKTKKKKERTNHMHEHIMDPLLHRAAINSTLLCEAATNKSN